MQANPPAPTLIMNASGTRQQVPLRDYLNSRIAPFVKKAMTESLESEAEFPLQWLGECLIHQSMLYEGNPDTTNIKERFRYNFEIPKAPTESEPQAQPVLNGTEATPAISADPGATAAASVAVPPPTDANMTNGEREASAGPNTAEAMSESIPPAQEEGASQSQDVDMEGTS